jgi:predicted TIM-barrel fold metal-dependent hydrolase
MAEPIKVDSHVHMYRTAKECQDDKDSYEVWEYGACDDVSMSELLGTVEDVLGAMQTAGVDKSIVLNLYMADWTRTKYLSRLPDELSEKEHAKLAAEFDAQQPEALMEFNRWGCRVSRDHPEIVSFVCTDVNVLSPEQGAAHVRDMVENEGARGVKLHGAVQGYFMDDRRLWPVYEACRDLGVAVIGHSGPDTAGRGFAEPRAFAETLKAFPQVNFVLAHLGGGSWCQAREIAASFPNANFDCCEIVEWMNSEFGPSEWELAQLISDVGADRVMMGSDFPWYDMDHTIGRILELPMLSDEQKHGILGANAVRILGLE